MSFLVVWWEKLLVHSGYEHLDGLAQAPEESIRKPENPEWLDSGKPQIYLD